MIVKTAGGLEDDIAYLEEFLATRCPERHRERLSRQLGKLVRGARGERFTMHVLNRHFGTHADHALIHNLRLSDGAGGYAQIDHLLLSRISRTVSLFESKAYGGTLTKNDHGEWAVLYGRKRIEIASPVEQVRLQRKAVERWLKLRRLDEVFRTVGCFVLVDPKTPIDRKAIGSREPVYRADNFWNNWVEFGGASEFGRLFSLGPSTEILKQTARALARSHEAPSENWLRSLGIANVPTIGPAETIPVDPEVPGADAPSEVDVVAEAQSAPTSGEIAGAPQNGIETLGITVRELPDGNIALRPGKSCSQDVRDQLAGFCQGRARWNSRFQNWITDADTAAEIAGRFNSGVSWLENSPTGELGGR